MIRGIEVLQSQLGKHLITGRFEYLTESADTEPHNVDPIVAFLRFEQWVELITSDDLTSAYYTEEPILGQEPWQGIDLVSHINPIENFFSGFMGCIGQILTGFSEIVDPKTYWTHGIKLYFGNGSTFTIWDEDVPDRSHFIFDGHIPQGLIEVQPNSRNLI